MLAGTALWSKCPNGTLYILHSVAINYFSTFFPAVLQSPPRSAERLTASVFITIKLSLIFSSTLTPLSLMVNVKSRSGSASINLLIHS